MAKIVYMRSPAGEVFSTEYPEYHKECENLGGGSKGYAARQEYARQQLREFIKPGDTVYYNVESVSRSGMSRVISFYVPVIGDNGKPRIRNINNLMGDAITMSQVDGGGLKSHGCGMNMGFAAIYNLGRALYPDGFGVEGVCPLGRKLRPLTKVKAEKAREKGFVFRGRNGDSSGWDNDGGYALNYSSL